jgi:hypothetical protein
LACHLQINTDPDPAYHFDADPDLDPPYHFATNPDPTFADLDPAFQFDADLDPTFQCDVDPDPHVLMRTVGVLDP